jgi:hypothetical protein
MYIIGNSYLAVAVPYVYTMNYKLSYGMPICIYIGLSQMDSLRVLACQYPCIVFLDNIDDGYLCVTVPKADGARREISFMEQRLASSICTCSYLRTYFIVPSISKMVVFIDAIVPVLKAENLRALLDIRIYASVGQWRTWKILKCARRWTTGP